ncbi:type II secretion system protein [bacterium]|nr:type II secretion system protein [bacterium]
MHYSRRAFTLIELLVVVGIISILTAIAVPNFLHAQIRAKVARAQADLRTLATALEAYAAEQGDYPYVQDKGGVEWQMPLSAPPGRTSPGGLTSPIPYLTRGLYDPFLLAQKEAGNQGNPLLYYERCGYGFDAAGVFSEIKKVRMPVDANGTMYGTAPDYEEGDPAMVPTVYVLYSVGPDLTHRVLNRDGSVLVRSRWSIYNRYDPTNGLTSPGNVVRFPSGLSFP